MAELPTGMITFLLSDVESSTLLWEEFPQQMSEALVRHDAIIEQAVASYGGTVVRPRGEGDSRFAVFEQADSAVKAACDIQQELSAGFDDLPLAIKVRIGLHTGSAAVRVGDYYGTAVNRCARIRGLGYGGQTLLSQVTVQLVQDELPPWAQLQELGSHHLKGLSRPEQIYQLCIEGLPCEFPPLQSAVMVLNNLPAMATDFIGRDQEVGQIFDLLCRPDVRLVTLTGPGGAGKTRLCLETARRLLDEFSHGVFFVDLAALADPALIASTIARSMGIREGGGRPPLDNLLDFLADKEMLLVLDNFEQIVDGAAVVAQVLVAAPGVKVLATSRIALSLRGEREYPVLSLRLPAPGEVLTVEQMLEYEAVHLFVERATAIRPSFQLTADNAPTILEICRRLDGLPLAIEIAAARIRILPPQAILQRLDQSLRLLVGGAKDLPTRQQTLRSAIDWSYELLEEDEKLLFARLSIFVGGFTLESAEGVCNPDGTHDILGVVETLVRNNLARQVPTLSDYPRFDMLLTIREYAQEKLQACGELQQMRSSHALYFGQQSEIDGSQLFNKDSTHWLGLMDEEHDNYRAALAYGLENMDGLEMAVRICVFLFWFWYRFGHFHEGRDWTDRVLAAAEAVGGVPYALALIAGSLMAMWEGDLDIAAARGQESVERFKRLSIPYGLSQAEMSYGVILINQGRDKAAYPHLLSAAELFDELGMEAFKATTLVHMANAALGLGEIKNALASLDRASQIVNQIQDPWQLGFCANNYGEVARVQGDFVTAEKFYRQTEEYYLAADAASDHARLIYALAVIAQHKEQYEKANVLFLESLSDFRELGNKRGIAECLAGIAGLSAVLGALVWALPLFSAAEALINSFGAAWWPADRVEFERTRDLLQEGIDEDEFARLWAAGQAMSMGQAIDYALKERA